MWPEGYWLTNGVVEALVVPAIGRVLQFRSVGDAEGAFWESSFDQAAPGEWSNFGGDKCWPAPQSSWPRQQGHAWPPPPGFDASPMQATVSGNSLLLTSPVDPTWGVQVVRAIELDAEKPRMRIQTEYRKVSGEPVRVGIWTVTQMREPIRIGMKLQASSRFPDSYARLLDATPADLRVQNGVLSLARHCSAYTKIGSDGSALAWVGNACVVRIEVQPEAGEYPDGGCVTEIYTNPDPLGYVELETLSPLATMHCGSSIRQTVTYTLAPRSCDDPFLETETALCSAEDRS